MSAACASVWLAVVGGHVAAAPKPTIAVLGIEPSDVTADAAADKATAALREQAGKRTGRFERKGTAKLIGAAIMKAECKTMHSTCASVVGSALGVEYVVAGELTKRGSHVVLVLALVDVRTRQRVRSLRETVASSSDAGRWARTMYERLIDTAAGDLVIVANAKRGEILLDSAVVGSLFDGRATISAVAAGAHQVAIRAAGYRPFEIEVTVDGTTTQTLLLDPVTP